MKDQAWRELQLRASICPGAETAWDPPETATHWKAMHDCKDELRGLISQARAAIGSVHNDKTLSAVGQREKRQQIVERAVSVLQQSTALSKAAEAYENQMAKWHRKIADVLKPAKTEAEVGLHAEIRKHVASLKGQERMRFLEKHGSDIAVASALFEAPAFLSGVNDAELALVRHKIEQAHLPPEIAEAKAKTSRAWEELERAARLAPSLVLQFAGMKQLPRHTNPSEPNAKAKATTPYWSKPTATTVNNASKPAPAPDWA